MDEVIQNPHDKLFKLVFTDKKNLQDFLTNNLPVEINNLIDYETLNIEKDSFIEPKFNETRSDLLITVNLNDKMEIEKKKSVNIYFLFEHKSYEDPAILLQLLGYMVNIWNRDYKNNGMLKPIIPIIYYHGEKEFRIKNFTSLFDSTELLNLYIPNINFLVHDLTRFKDQDIKGGILLKISELIFKYSNIKDKDVSRKAILKILDMFPKLLSTTNTDYWLKIYIRYLLSATEIKIEEIKNKFERSNFLEGGNIVMSTAELLIKEGLEQGLDEGKKFREKEIVKNMLSKGLDLSFITDMTGLTEDEILAIADE